MRKAFTLIELLVVVAIIAVLVTILVPVVMTGLGRSETAVCQSNLGVIGRKYNDYANDSVYADRPFPRQTQDDSADPKLDILANPNTVTIGDVTGLEGLRTNGGTTLDVLLATGIGTCGMQSVWILIEQGFLPDSAFKCPGDADYLDRRGSAMLKFGWTKLTEFSYGIHYPYDGAVAVADNVADPMDKDVNRRFTYRENMPLFTDRNPGGAVDNLTRFHSNHRGTDGGAMIVSRIGNTKFYQGENDSKIAGDNIYTDAVTGEAPANAALLPADAADTIITPVVSR